MKIKVAFLPTSPLPIAGDVCIVVDVIRATTALVGLFDAGSDRVFVGGFRSDVTKARAAVGENGIICAELDDGSTPLGFDHEPSPSLLSRLDLSGRSAMLATANGTPAILAAVREGAALILLGSLRNLDAVTRRALAEASSRNADITIICSGQLRNSRVAIEDSYCAGLIVSRFCPRAKKLPMTHGRDYLDTELPLQMLGIAGQPPLHRQEYLTPQRHGIGK
ncbi:MAG: 2-phosphosulfolactate phosphatase [Mesorhizobium sp.]|uniref:2-phosphosulfolactate phosphatase n=1 Tax=Mesorhizobium sp. TaxID=1871066 RepID=UPI0011FB13A0|nr:2-phosphosulfolactate phosphatase [Mesorhizobium sp.]TIP69627.1 MAG: 2-phosphosulfolactate phosphatase [Mesorhizobium sp.]TIR47535.1 MAG: 2-phosphosulfolactate phosphatase [Mesorhizobium sp.]TJV91758.1 MAG: 2-phosphosulfolactate phosphatase [Mesorhizobium sp.]